MERSELFLDPTSFRSWITFYKKDFPPQTVKDFRWADPMETWVFWMCPTPMSLQGWCPRKMGMRLVCFDWSSDCFHPLSPWLSRCWYFCNLSPRLAKQSFCYLPWFPISVWFREERSKNVYLCLGQRGNELATECIYLQNFVSMGLSRHIMTWCASSTTHIATAVAA